MIETVRQAPGRFDLALDDPPGEIKDLTSRAFAALVVTPTHINHRAYSVADMLGLAHYTGIMTRRSRARTRIEGYGPAWLLTRAVHEDDASVVARPVYDGSNPSWIRNHVLRLTTSQNNGIVAGTISSSASPTKKGKINAGDTPLDVLGQVCRMFNKEWRVNPDGTLDVGSTATLFPTYTTPTAIAAPLGGGRSLTKDELEGSEFEEADDWDDFTTEVVVAYRAEDYDWGRSYAVGDTVTTRLWTDDFYECKVAHTSSAFNQPPNATYWTAVARYSTSTSGSVALVNPFTADDIVARRTAAARNTADIGDAEEIGDRILARWDQSQQELSIDSTTHTISDTVAAGDYIWAYDPDLELYDTANQEYVAGRPVHPVKIRVHAVRDACSHGRGYYLISWNGSSQEVHDLTPYVAFEDPGVTLELGKPRRARRRPQRR